MTAAERAHSAVTPAPPRTSLLLCAVGLLFTVTEVNGFGFDFASDTVGHALVAVGATIQRPRNAWWVATSVAAVLAAVVGLFTYGGVASKLFSGSYVLWESAYSLATLLSGAVVALLAVALRSADNALSFGARGSTYRSMFLGTVAPMVVVLTVVPVVMGRLEVGIYGPASYLRQLFGVLAGLLALAVVVLLLLASRDPAPASPAPGPEVR